MSYFAQSAVPRSILNYALSVSNQNFPLNLFPKRARQKTFPFMSNLPAQKYIVRNFSYSVTKLKGEMALQAPPKELMAPMNVPQKLLMVSQNCTCRKNSYISMCIDFQVLFLSLH